MAAPPSIDLLSVEIACFTFLLGAITAFRQRAQVKQPV
jgi:hypothetical protein